MRSPCHSVLCGILAEIMSLCQGALIKIRLIVAMGCGMLVGTNINIKR